MADAEQFRKELEEFAEEEILGKAIDVQKRILGEVLMQVVQRTPVGERSRWKNNIKRAQRGLPPLPRDYVGGHARKNWQVKLKRRPTNEIEGEDSRGQATIDKGLGQISKIDDLMIGYVANLVPYMQRLEDGWSQSAAKGEIVSDTVALVMRKFRRIR